MRSMRIMQVSAHFPPDFVSGGTLIPQRLAQAAQAAGHEVRVFAGNYYGVETLEEFDTVEAGIRAHWIGNRGFASWDLDENYANPAVSQRFETFLADFRPHVVHFHSIHTLGAEMLEVARSYGAAVVVTMHDFWWVCARQFLVDADTKPCPFDVAGGGCDCSRTHEWLLERNAWLGERLALADAILVPAATMLSILERNGIDVSKVIVSPNGLEHLEVPGRRPEVAGPVRFMYAGGPSEYKGYDVLREACGLFEPPEGTVLDLYGAPSEGFPHWAHSWSAYSREEAPGTFAGHDVLVLPSIARESFSILAREALAAGLAVITSDAPGPMEVVDESNGIVVPAGDAAALAGAMERLCGRGELALLTAGARNVSFVTAHEQWEQTLGIYKQCRSRAVAEGRAVRATRILVASGSPHVGEAGFALWRALEDSGFRSDWRIAAEPFIEGYLPVTDVLALDGDIPEERARELREACSRAGTQILRIEEACEAIGVDFPAVVEGKAELADRGIRSLAQAGRTRARLEVVRVGERFRMIARKTAGGRLARGIRGTKAPLLALVDGTGGAGMPYRLEWAAEALSSVGYEAQIFAPSSPEMPGILAEVEAVLLHGIGEGFPLWCGIEKARAGGVRIVFDVDSSRALEVLAGVAERCDGLLAASRSLAHAAREACGLPVAVAEDVIGPGGLVSARYLATLGRPEGPERIGIFLAPANAAEAWKELGDAPVRLAAAYPDLEFWHDGCLDSAPIPPSVASRMHRADILGFDSRMAVIRSVDVFLAPAHRGDAGGAGMPVRAWREAALAGRPLVASATEAGVGLFEDGRNVLIASTENDWVHRVAALLESPVHRENIAGRARNAVVGASRLGEQGLRWLEGLRRI